MADDTPTRDEVERLAGEARGQRLLLAALDICASGRRVASKHLCGEARDQIRALSAALERAERERDEARDALEKVRREERERAVKWLQDGFQCRSCGTAFLSDNPHDDEDCAKGYARWDTLDGEGLYAAIRGDDDA